MVRPWCSTDVEIATLLVREGGADLDLEGLHSAGLILVFLGDVDVVWLVVGHDRFSSIATVMPQTG